MHSPLNDFGDAHVKSSAVKSEKVNTTTINATGNAIDTQIPSFLVLSGQRMRQEHVQECVPGSSGDMVKYRNTLKHIFLITLFKV